MFFVVVVVSKCALTERFFHPLIFQVLSTHFTVSIKNAQNSPGKELTNHSMKIINNREKSQENAVKILFFRKKQQIP